MKFTKVGMRTIKTVIAVILTLIVSEKLNLRSPILAAIAAIMTMEGSVSGSFNTGKTRMYGTILGGAVALIISFIAPENFIFIALGLIIIINTCNMLKIENAARISMVVFLVIILNYKDGDGFAYAINRTLDTLVGVIIGTATNYFVGPPKIEEKIKKIIDEMYIEVKRRVASMVWEDVYLSLDTLRKEILDIEENYKILVKNMQIQVETSDNVMDYKKIFELFINIYNHLSIISSIIEEPYIDGENQRLLEEFFTRKLASQEKRKMEDLDLIYNFHLKKILVELGSVEAILKQDIELGK